MFELIEMYFHWLNKWEKYGLWVDFERAYDALGDIMRYPRWGKYMAMSTRPGVFGKDGHYWNMLMMED